MGPLAKIIAAILGISFFVFVTFFGRLPALRHTPIAFLHRVIWVHIPNALYKVDLALTSGRVTSYTSRFMNYMLYDRHPTVLIFFFLLLSVGEYMYLPTAWPQLSTFHKVAGSFAMVFPYVFLYLASFSDPGYVTPANHAHEMARYPYDYTIFHPGSECRTCKLLKPARSKHCSVCKRCISRLDHHCIFINNCVGAGNQHWFILLLLSTGALTVYGGVLGVSIITAKITEQYPYWSMWPWSANGGEGIVLKEWLLLWSWGLQDMVSMGAVTFLAIMTSPLTWSLLGYHIYLIYCGTTTNETLKWGDWQLEMDDGCAFKRTMPSDRVKDSQVEAIWTRWPVETEQIMLRTNDGKPPAAHLILPGEGEWERVWNLRDVENLYDLGFWDNLIDVFFPGYQFRDSQTPMSEGSYTRKRKKRKGRK
ncbi:zf-DHHC-domain-containing protein [Thozetella sp. PMI_491]|nr:zf-DHHC-domain-containing protein [Thozetella sp. PMI_491]